MQLSTIVTAFLLPLLAVAEPPEGAPAAPATTEAPLTTVTRTTSQTLTKTIYLTKADTATMAANGTAKFTPSPSGGSETVVAPPKITNAGSVMGGTHVAMAAFAGMVAVALL